MFLSNQIVAFLIIDISEKKQSMYYFFCIEVVT